EVDSIASTKQATITTATSFDANNASFAGNISTRVWTSPTTWVEKCKFESTGNAYISGTMNVIGDISSSTGNISTTSGDISTGSDKCKFEPTGNGYFDGTVRCKGGLNVGDPTISPAKCTILGLSGAITTQSSINAGGNIASDGNISFLGSISAGTTLS
ncbi:MAG: hypothetical protein ACKPKO_46775, partial [Candidatus Fonsibacter sp.]